MQAKEQRDGLGVGLLVLGVALAVGASLLPAIQVNGRGGVVGLTTWQALPVFTALEMAALAALLAAAVTPALRPWRQPIAAGAIIMLFVPALSTFLSALYAWGELRAEIARLSGERQPFVHPGPGNALLVAAACLLTYAAWRMERLAGPGAAATPAAAAGTEPAAA
ncbi:hypothetical protein [Rubritepida flocculans]|uniref:hypothetical protein n=1 Tax=Rubritepida flocculans TaxID=182403 RepID=UPI0004047300|nr:hypothetical protein [Rubritepida flocculans]